MSLYAKTSAPKGLPGRIRDAIDAGHIKTWDYDDDGDFTHVTHDGQWEGQAWFRAQISLGQVNFRLVGIKAKCMPNVVYAVYHGRFAEMLIEHFSDAVADVRMSSKPTPRDMLKLCG